MDLKSLKVTKVRNIGPMQDLELFGFPGWSIEEHFNGLTLCSPGTDSKELGFRNEEECFLWDLLPEEIQDEYLEGWRG